VNPAYSRIYGKRRKINSPKVRQSFSGRASYLLEMNEPVYAFSQHIGTLCVTHDTKVDKLGAKPGVDPAELLRMFNGRAPASKARRLHVIGIALPVVYVAAIL
jgi:hypothetical protein